MKRCMKALTCEQTQVYLNNHHLEAHRNKCTRVLRQGQSLRKEHLLVQYQRLGKGAHARISS